MRKAIFIATCVLFQIPGAWAQVAQSLVIHTNTGHTQTYNIQEIDSITFSPEPSVQYCKWYQTIENPGIADYLRDFEYDSSDYSYHKIFEYRGEPYLDKRQDWPYGVTIGDTVYFNLIPNRTYSLKTYFNQEEKTVKIHTLGQLRMLKAEGIDNVRDLGGWQTNDRKSIRYGRIIRGTEMNTLITSNTNLNSAHNITNADRAMLRNEIGICAELDLRNITENPNSEMSALGRDIEYKNIPISYTDISDKDNQQKIVQCLRFINEQLAKDRTIYLHCIWGADRTGVLCMLLEGLLGVSQSDIDKDYELTSFSGNTRYRTNTYYLRALNQVLLQPGINLQQKFDLWWHEAGATDEDIRTLCELMKE